MKADFNIFLIITFLLASIVASRSEHTEQILRNSALYRAQTAGYYHVDESDYVRKDAPIAAQ